MADDAQTDTRAANIARAFHRGFVTRHSGTVTGMMAYGIERGSFHRVNPMGLPWLLGTGDG